MSYQQLADDQAYIDALDAAVAQFKATVATGGEEMHRAKNDVMRAMLGCMFHGAAVRGEERRRREAQAGAGAGARGGQGEGRGVCPRPRCW